MKTRPRYLLTALAGTLLAGALVCSAAQAQEASVQLRGVTSHSSLPRHVVLPVPPLIARRVVGNQPEPVWQSPPSPPRRDWGYRELTRWDVDGDGIPNRYDRVYNPRWDRDGDGVPNRYDPTPQGGRGWQGHPDLREQPRQEPRGEWRDNRQADRRNDWREERRDDRRDDYRRGRHD